MSRDELAEAADELRSIEAECERRMNEARRRVLEIADAEERRGVTKTAIARRAGYSTVTIRKWARGFDQGKAPEPLGVAA